MGQQRKGRGASGGTRQGKESRARQDKQSQGGNGEEAGDWNESKASENRRSRDGKSFSDPCSNRSSTTRVVVAVIALATVAIEVAPAEEVDVVSQ